MKRPDSVVITAVGLITPLGPGTEASWARLCCSQTEEFPEAVMTAANGFDAASAIADRKLLKVIRKDACLGIAAGLAALSAGGLSPQQITPERFGVFTGCGRPLSTLGELEPAVRGSLDADGRFSLERFGREGAMAVDPMMLLRSLPNAGYAHLSRLCCARGANGNFMTGSLAGSQAVASACTALRRREIDVAIAGGFEALPAYGMTANATFVPLAPASASTPYDAGSRGIFLGEGAAMLLLETLEHASARGATMLASISAIRMSSDTAGGSLPSFHTEALERAIAAVGSDSDCVIGAAAGHTDFDHSEIRAIHAVWPGGRPRLLSIRGSTGHLGAAGGPAGVAVCALALHHDCWPGSRRIGTRFSDDDFDHLEDGPRPTGARHSLVIDRDPFGRNVVFAIGKAE